MKVVWHMLKQEIRRRKWESKAEMKKVLQDEWKRISVKELQRRIADMPTRCKILANSDDEPIKSDVW